MATIRDKEASHDEDEPWIEAQGGLYDSHVARKHSSSKGLVSSSQVDNAAEHVDDDDDDEVDWGMNHQLFADPDPIQDFHLEWQVPGDPNSGSTSTISIDLRGHKPENGQTLSSTGLTLWRGSELLCQYLLQHAQELFHVNHAGSTTVLELGAGLGVCGILAHRLGAARVVLTDGDSETLQWLRANVQRNNLSPSDQTSSSSSSSTTITCVQLQWGLHLERFQQRIGIPTFDLIMASDIIYVEEILHPLWQTVQALLAPHPDGKFCLSFVRRNVSWDLVLAVAQQYDMELMGIPPLPVSREDGDVYQKDNSLSSGGGDLTTATARDGVFVFRRKQPVTK